MDYKHINEYIHYISLFLPLLLDIDIISIIVVVVTMGSTIIIEN